MEESSGTEPHLSPASLPPAPTGLAAFGARGTGEGQGRAVRREMHCQGVLTAVPSCIPGQPAPEQSTPTPSPLTNSPLLVIHPATRALINPWLHPASRHVYIQL